MALTLTANVDCAKCGTVNDVDWAVPDADVREDIVDTPVTRFTCSGCGQAQDAEYPGWGFNTEAG